MSDSAPPPSDAPIFTRTPSLGSRFRRSPSTDKIDGTGAIIATTIPTAAAPTPATDTFARSSSLPIAIATPIPVLRTPSEIKREETARDLLVRLDSTDDYDAQNLLSVGVIGNQRTQHNIDHYHILQCSCFNELAGYLSLAL
jgi:hypothetical protein